MSDDVFPKNAQEFSKTFTELLMECYEEGFYDCLRGDSKDPRSVLPLMPDIPLFHALSVDTWNKVMEALKALKDIPIARDALGRVYGDIAEAIAPKL